MRVWLTACLHANNSQDAARLEVSALADYHLRELSSSVSRVMRQRIADYHVVPKARLIRGAERTAGVA